MTKSPQFDMQPTLIGKTILLRPIQADDFEALYAAGIDPLTWEQTPYPLRHQRPLFQEYFNAGLASGGALVAIEKDTWEIVGSSRYYEWNPELKEVAIGYTFLTRRCWGGAANKEMKQLMLNHAFQSAGTVWFHVAMSNTRSRRAMEKIGGIFAFNQDREVSGVMHDYAYYRIDAPATLDPLT